MELETKHSISDKKKGKCVRISIRGMSRRNIYKEYST